MLNVEGADVGFTPGDQRGWRVLRELQDGELFRVVAQRSRLVENARAFALGLAQQVGGVEVLAVEGRVLAHHHGVSLAQLEGSVNDHGAKPAVLTALALDLDVIRQRDLTRVGRDEPTGHPTQVARLAGQQAMAATLRLAHHGEGGVLVGLEGLQRVGNEKNLHGV